MCFISFFELNILPIPTIGLNWFCRQIAFFMSVKITQQDRKPIVIVKNDGQEIQSVTPPAKVPVVHNHVQVEHPLLNPIDLSLNPEVAQQMAARKASMTYTIDQIRQKRHQNETTAVRIFQFHAELQLYKRSLSKGGNKYTTKTQSTNAPVLQHQINNILLGFNLNTFQKVFNQICSLGIESDVFALSYVNVVFKQAVLNPSLAFLFSLFTKNLLLVIKHTKYAEKVRSLFVERCCESFLVPKPDTNKGTLILLRGIVTFVGNLIRDGVIKISLLDEWMNLLLASDYSQSIRLLIELLNGGGISLIQHIDSKFESLNQKMKVINEEDIQVVYNKLIEVRNSAIPEPQQIDDQINKPEMHQSPSIDRELDGQYGKLFKKSTSVPQNLAELADSDDQEGLSHALYSFFIGNRIEEFLDSIQSLGYGKDAENTAHDLINSICQQSEDKLPIVSKLVIELYQKGFYTIEQLKLAFQVVSKDASKPTILSRLFAFVVSSEIFSFDDFEPLFKDMKANWNVAIPAFLIEMDKIKGSIFEDINDSDFWKNQRFTQSTAFAERVSVLKQWDILGFYPEYDIVSQFAETSQTPKEATNFVLSSLEAVQDSGLLASLLFQQLLLFPEPLANDYLHSFSGFFSKNKASISALDLSQHGASLIAKIK